VADVKEESEKEDEPAPKSVKKTPRKSVKEDPGAFSDYNPFQSGSEAAADRERRRRKVSLSTTKSVIHPLIFAVVDWTWTSQASTTAILGAGTQARHPFRRYSEASRPKHREPTNPILRV
jgi:hypothetical protein